MPDLDDFRERGDQPGEVWKLTGENSVHTALQAEASGVVKMFSEIAQEQGWDLDSQYRILRDFINNQRLGNELRKYAAQRAAEENETTE